MSKLSEPYWLAWLKWHAYRKRDPERYAKFWRPRQLIHGLPDGGLLVDCGANVGDLSRLFLAKDYTVHAIEPDPDARAILTRRLGASARMTIHAVAVGAHADRLTLYRKPGAAGSKAAGTISSSLVKRDLHADSESVEVDVVDIFAFLDGLGRKVDVLKLDIEGVEVPILERMLDLRYDRKIGLVLVETHERFSDDIARRTQAIRQRIAALGIANIDLDWN